MMQKIIIFGATGMTGLCSLDAAVKKSLTTKIFVRDENKVPENMKNKVEIIVGDVLNAEQVLNAVEGVDGVVVVLGTRNDFRPTTVMSNGMINIIAAMKTHNVEIVTVCLSTSLFYKPEKVPKLYINTNADHRRTYDALKISSLKYVAIFPPQIVETPSKEFKVEIDKAPGKIISKWDLGKFLVDALSHSEYYGRVVSLANVA